MKKIVVFISFLFGLLAGFLIFNKSDEAAKRITSATFSTPTPQTEILETKSIDGKIKLIMHTKPQVDGLTLYSFIVSGEEGENTIFAQTTKSNAFTLPQNSWSPDSSFVFIVENNLNFSNVLVFKASGEPFSDTEKYINATRLFENKQQDYILSEATGWDSRGLLHIKTKKTDSSKGPSFWFDVDSRSFIQLAAR